MKKFLQHNKYASLLTLFILGVVFMFSFYGQMLLHPNQYMFNNQGDGMKNYFTYAYPIHHADKLTEFKGMNYPYGENFLYTDGQPALSLPFTLLAKTFPVFDTHSVGILNFVMILSIFLCFFVCYFLLLELGVNRWHCVLFSISITILAPQIFRLGGHFALSYSLAFPLHWLLILRFDKNKKRSLIILFMITVFWLFIHAYLGMILIAFFMLYLLVSFLLQPDRKKNLLRYGKALLIIVAAIALYYLVGTLTDQHTGRTKNPSGFFLYNAEPDDVFLPHSDPLGPVVNRISNNTIKQEWEAWSYVGMSTTLLCAGLLILSLVSIFKRKTRAQLKEFFQNKPLNISLLAALGCFIFAMGFPFKQFPVLLDYLPIIKQFRATGRFTWPLYFVLSSFAAIGFYQLSLRIQSRYKTLYATLFILLIFGFNLLEGMPYHRITRDSITQDKNLFRKDLLEAHYHEALDSISSNSCQALIPLPFVHFGSESYARLGSDESMRNTMTLSYHSGIPIMGSQLGRTSIEESKRLVQLMSPNYYAKPIINDFPDKRPFLIVRSRQALSDYEKMILQKGKVLCSNNDFELLEISFDQLFADAGKEVLAQYKQKHSSLQVKNGFLVTDSAAFLYYNDFEVLPSEKRFRGQGAFRSQKKGVNSFVEFPPNTFEKGIRYHFSLWMHNGEADALNLWFRVLIEEYQEGSGSFRIAEIFPDQAETINGPWSLVESSFIVQKPEYSLRIFSKGKDNSKAALHADDLLIRREGIDVYRKSKGDISELFYNNHRIANDGFWNKTYKKWSSTKR